MQRRCGAGTSKKPISSVQAGRVARAASSGAHQNIASALALEHAPAGASEGPWLSSHHNHFASPFGLQAGGQDRCLPCL